MLIKILIGLTVLIILAIAGVLIYINTGYQVIFPEDTDQIIQDILDNDDLPEIITGETGYAQNGDVKIWYELMNGSDSAKGTVLLVMGHSATAITWTKNFYQPLIDAGYQVIRYDNRGLGASDWMKDWNKKNAYSLEDMAKDGIAILDALGVEKAHIIGASMGGMIAQTMALDHSDRVASLTSIMSSGFMDDKSIKFPKPFVPKLVKLTLRYTILNPSEFNIMKFRVGVKKLLKGEGPYEIDTKATAQRTLYELRKRKGFNSKVGDQHTAAISKSGSRLERLGNIIAPTLVIHGTTDPLVVFEHGQKYAPLIPKAETLFVEGMGHDMANCYMSRYHEAIFRNFAKSK